MRSRIPKASKRVGDSSSSHYQGSHTRIKLHNCHIYAECLGQFHAGFPTVGSVFVRPSEARLVDGISFLVESLTALAPIILLLLLLLLLQDSRSSANCLTVGLHLSPSVSGQSLSDDDWARHQSMSIAIISLVINHFIGFFCQSCLILP